MQLMLACGSMHLTNFQITMILLVLAAIVSLPIFALANLWLAASVDRERLPMHLGLFAVYAIPGLIWWNQHEVWSFEVQMVCCILIANLIIAQFAFLFFKAWRRFRARRRERANARQTTPEETPYSGPRCVACDEAIAVGVVSCSKCGWTQPTFAS